MTRAKLVVLAALAVGCVTPRAKIPHDEGTVVAQSQERYAHLPVPPGCVLENNVWNDGAARGAR